MTPVRLTIQGFKCFKEQTRLVFPKTPGFFLITGKNKLEPAMGANSCGKSSLFDAICYVLYGTTARGLKANDIATWGEEQLYTEVSLTFFQNDICYTLTRTRNPNALTLKLPEVPSIAATQEEVNQLIGLNLEGFLASVLMGQFNQFFFDLKPADKLQVFSEALQLGYWTDKAKEVKGRAEEANTLLTQLKIKRESIKSLIMSSDTCRSKLIESETSFEESKKTLLTSLKTRVIDTKEKIKNETKEERRFKARVSELQVLNEQAIDRLTTLDQQVKKEERDLYQKRVDLKGVTKEYNNKVDQYDGYRKEVRCNRCGQELNKEQRKTVLGKLRKELDQLDRQVNTLQEEIEQSKVIYTLSKGARDHQEANVRIVQGNIQQAHKELTRASKELAVLHTVLQNLEDQLQQGRENPYTQQRIQVEEQLEQLNQERVALTLQIRKTDNLVGKLTHWTTLMKELRLWLIQIALQQLEVEVNNVLIALGLKGWSVSCEIERENKSGGVSRGFQVLITSPDSNGPQRWECWCGGETQRLRIAGARGLATLIRNRSGTDFKMEVWDEPTAHLSDEGITDLLTYFEGIVRETDRQIYLVDHRVLTAGNFTGEIQVIKGHNGSRIASDRFWWGMEGSIALQPKGITYDTDLTLAKDI